jgi:hypothetical protein
MTTNTPKGTPMLNRTLASLAITAMTVLGIVSTAAATSGHDPEAHHANHQTLDRQLDRLRHATARYRHVSRALRDGHTAFAIPAQPGATPTTGLGLVGDPTCFDDPSGGMGVHYVKGIDGTVDLERPEALVYEITRHHRLRLVAVEYIVPDSFVDPANPPRLLGQHFHRHPYLPVYILHVWAWKANPNGLFADFNPRVRACPTPEP